jgi:hypothetical protein
MIAQRVDITKFSISLFSTKKVDWIEKYFAIHHPQKKWSVCVYSGE